MKRLWYFTFNNGTTKVETNPAEAFDIMKYLEPDEKYTEYVAVADRKKTRKELVAEIKVLNKEMEIMKNRITLIAMTPK